MKKPRLVNLSSFTCRFIQGVEQRKQVNNFVPKQGIQKTQNECILLLMLCCFSFSAPNPPPPPPYSLSSSDKNYDCDCEYHKRRGYRDVIYPFQKYLFTILIEILQSLIIVNKTTFLELKNSSGRAESNRTKRCCNFRGQQVLQQKFITEMTKNNIRCCYLVTKLCPTLCDPTDHSPPDSSVHGISQARILEWLVIFFSRGSSQPRDRTNISCIGRRVLYRSSTREAQE